MVSREVDPVLFTVSHQRKFPCSNVFGITSNTLVRSSQSSSASDGYGLGRGAAGPDRRCTTSAAEALRVIV